LSESCTDSGRPTLSTLHNQWDMRPALLLGEEAQSRALDLTPITLAVTHLPPGMDGLRIAHVTDTHFRAPGPLLDKTVDLLTNGRPDLIAVTGDLINYPAGPEVGAAFLRRVVPLAPTFVVLGNHEHKRSLRLTPVAEVYADAGAIVLMNDAVRWEHEGSAIWIAGVDDPFEIRHDLERAFAPVPPGAPTILLAHSPAPARAFAAAGASVILCGHTHGGQVRLPFIGPIRLHNRMERRFCSGVFGAEEIGAGPWDPDPSMVVSRGVGALRLPIRIFCPPEIPLITLRSVSSMYHRES